jgi:hypothetical protein
MTYKHRYSPTIILFSLLAFLFFWSCEKEEFLLEETIENSTAPQLESEVQTKQELAVASLELQQSIKSSLLISAGKIDDSKDGSDEVEFSTLLETILKGQAIKVSSETLSYDAYSYFVPTGRRINNLPVCR